MKMPGKVRSMIDEMEGLSSSDKAKLVRHLNDMADSLPEHPTPAEATRIVKGALKALEIKVGKKEKDEEPKEEKPKKEKKEEVKESVSTSKLTFKAFLEGIAGKQPVPLKDIIKIVYDSTMPMHVVDVLKDAAKKQGIAQHQPLNKQRLKELCHAAGLKEADTEEVLELVGFYD